MLHITVFMRTNVRANSGALGSDGLTPVAGLAASGLVLGFPATEAQCLSAVQPVPSCTAGGLKTANLQRRQLKVDLDTCILQSKVISPQACLYEHAHRCGMLTHPRVNCWAACSAGRVMRSPLQA
jgi:hypothetical protein